MCIRDSVDGIISSPALRAITTAKCFATQLEIPINSIKEERKIYEASPDTLMELLQELDNTLEKVILFGHNPGLSYLTGLLTGELYDKVTCSISEIELHIEEWSSCSVGIGSLISYDYPKNL